MRGTSRRFLKENMAESLATQFDIFACPWMKGDSLEDLLIEIDVEFVS